MTDGQDDEFFSQQGLILNQLTHALVEATPECWNEAKLELEASDEGLGHVITSTENPDAIVTPTDEIFAQTMALQDLFISKSRPFKTATIQILRRDRDGLESWKLKVAYTY